MKIINTPPNTEKLTEPNGNRRLTIYEDEIIAAFNQRVKEIEDSGYSVHVHDEYTQKSKPEEDINFQEYMFRAGNRKENLYEPNCIRTFSGQYVNVFEPDPAKLLIEDVAHALAMQPRFGGHLPVFYSVAEHCIHGVRMLKQRLEKPDKQALYNFLMHDASEAYLLDIPSPIKARLANYKEIEDGLMWVLAAKFGFQWPLSDFIKEIDRFMLEQEWNQIMLGNRRQDLTPEQGKSEFLKLYEQLKPNATN